MAKKRFEPEDLLENVDVPILVFIGCAALQLLVAVWYIILGSLIDGVGSKTCLMGLICLAMSVAMIGIASLYWKFIVKRYGVISPAENGFGLVFAIIASLYNMWLLLGSMFGNW